MNGFGDGALDGASGRMRGGGCGRVRGMRAGAAARANCRAAAFCGRRCGRRAGGRRRGAEGEARRPAGRVRRNGQPENGAGDRAAAGAGERAGVPLVRRAFEAGGACRARDVRGLLRRAAARSRGGSLLRGARRRGLLRRAGRCPCACGLGVWVVVASLGGSPARAAPGGRTGAASVGNAGSGCPGPAQRTVLRPQPGAFIPGTSTRCFPARARRPSVSGRWAW